MTETRITAPRAVRERAVLGFLREALGTLQNRRLAPAALFLAILITLAMLLLARQDPQTRQDALLAIGVEIVSVLGLLLAAVAMLRVMTGSPRRAWIPDGGMWLYGVTLLFGLGVLAAVTWLSGGRTGPVAGLATGAAVSLVTAPFAAWFTAIAVERPLAWRAGQWVRGFAGWLPHLVFWSLLVVVPLGEVQALVHRALILGGEWFLPLAIVNGLVGTALALLGLALAATAYRRVARR